MSIYTQNKKAFILKTALNFNTILKNNYIFM